MTIILFTLAAVAFYRFTVKRNSLTPSGAGAAVGLAATVTFTAGPAWLLPLFAFFGSSVLLGRLLPSHAAAGDAKAGRPRDHVQVLCNGGVYALIAALQGPPILLLMAMAVATADTWASEIGKYLGQPTYDVLRWRRVPVGLSGGVSLGGSLGAVAGALFIGLCGSLLVDDYRVGAIVLFGIAGMFIDSVLGAGLQARYRDPLTGQLNDRAGRQVGGLVWVTNDVVNLLAITLTIGLAYSSSTW